MVHFERDGDFVSLWKLKYIIQQDYHLQKRSHHTTQGNDSVHYSDVQRTIFCVFRVQLFFSIKLHFESVTDIM